MDYPTIQKRSGIAIIHKDVRAEVVALPPGVSGFTGYFGLGGGAELPWASSAGDEISDKQAVTVGRKKRKRKKGAGSGVKIKSHTRSPRGSNKGKKPVRVDGYKRGKPPKRSRSRRKR